MPLLFRTSEILSSQMRQARHSELRSAWTLGSVSDPEVVRPSSVSDKQVVSLPQLSLIAQLLRGMQFLNEVASIAWMDPIRAPLDSLRRSAMERKEGRREGVGVAGAINGNADRRGERMRAAIDRSVDGAIFGGGRRQHWAVQLELLWLDMEFLGWFGLKHPVVCGGEEWRVAHGSRDC